MVHLTRLVLSLCVAVVPTYKPGFALALFTKFINNEDF